MLTSFATDRPIFVLFSQSDANERPIMHSIQSPTISYSRGLHKHLRMTTVTLRPVAAEAPVEVLGWVCAQAVPAVRTDDAAFLLRLADLLLQLRGTGVDELELRELSVEDADDLCELSDVSIGQYEC